jgi:hypothetical protein
LNTGINVSKLNSYAVLTPPAGVDVTKLTSHVVLIPPTGVRVAKVVCYVVLGSPNVNPPVWPVFAFVNGFVGNAYAQSFDLSPAAPPTTYTVLSGSLPPGLSLVNVGADVGKIQGTPTTTGVYAFTLRATNAYGTADQAFSITILSPVVISGGGFAMFF